MGPATDPERGAATSRPEPLLAAIGVGVVAMPLAAAGVVLLADRIGAAPASVQVRERT
jgi:hypothetical protein